MNNPSYLPRTNGGLRPWVINFAALITADEAAYELEPADSAAINAVVTPWVTAYDLTQSPETDTPAAVADANAKKAAMLAVVRPYAVGINRNPNVTEENKTAVGCIIYSTTKTPVPVPTAVPLLSVENNILNQARIRVNNSETPTSKAAPLGCSGVQVFIKYGAEFTNDPSAASYANQYTRSPFWLNTTGKSGQKCSLFARYVTRNGGGGEAKFGPWSTALQFVVA